MFWPAAKLPLVTFFLSSGLPSTTYIASHILLPVSWLVFLFFRLVKSLNVLISFVGCEWIEPYVKYHLSFSFVFKILFILNLDHSTVCYSLFCLSRERPFVPNVHMESIVWRPIRYTTLRVGWFAGFTHRFRRRTDMRIVALFWAEKGNQYSVKLTCQSPCWWASDVSLLLRREGRVVFLLVLIRIVLRSSAC